MVRLSTVRSAIDQEPEFPDQMPDEMWEAIKNDREACEKAFKMTVIETKAGIKSRLSDMLDKGLQLQRTGAKRPLPLVVMFEYN